MDSGAVEQAKRHLLKAKRAREQLGASSGVEETRSLWTDFLLASAGIFEILKAGSKASGKSAAWFGRVKKERKDDELLRYLHHARNSDYHGLQEVTDGKGVSGLRLMPDGTYAGYMTDDPDAVQLVSIQTFAISPDGTETEIVTPMTIKSYATLIPVVDDLHGDTCPVPTSHWGMPYVFHEPLNCAATVMPYLEALVVAAEGMISPKKHSHVNLPNEIT